MGYIAHLRLSLFDLLITNRESRAYDLVAIKLSVFDIGGQLELKRELNENGNPPALDVIAERRLQPGAVIDIFQPFSFSVRKLN